MCGRTAQTIAAIRAAAERIGAPNLKIDNKNGVGGVAKTDAGTSMDSVDETSSDWKGNNYNLCPGMGAIVFFKNKEGVLVSESKVWGLITKHGSAKNPLPLGMAQHFSALMYNARSDTLFIKQTFGNLLAKKQSCIVAVDGWFEWKQEVKGKKQPYFVKAKHEPFILFPGLWTQVATGRSDEPYLNTFTILTTDVDPSLKWLHTRMPVCCFDLNLAQEWLNNPTQKLHEQLLENNYSSSPDQSCRWEWHAVSDEMTSLKFRSDRAIAPWKRQTIQNFFVAKRNGETSAVENFGSQQIDLMIGQKRSDPIDVDFESIQSLPMFTSSSEKPSKVLASPVSLNRSGLSVCSPVICPNELKTTERNQEACSNGNSRITKTPKTQSVSSPPTKKRKTSPKESIASFFLPRNTSKS